MTTLYDVLRRPLITEKSNFQNTKLHQVAFEVNRDATKAMIKEAVEFLFEVKVQRVNVLNVPAKTTRSATNRRSRLRRSGYRKAIVTLAPGQTVDIFEGVK
ncbi:MAG: 50S ribosomal protein L23 [Anaerolineales bacterium]